MFKETAMRYLRVLYAALAALIVTACVPHPAHASPQPYGMRLDAVGDTIRATISPCVAPAGGAAFVACEVTLSGTVGATPIAFPTIGNFSVGETRVITVAITCTPRAVITVTGVSRGINADGVVGAPVPSNPGSATCRDALPGQPATWTVILQLVTSP